MAKIPMHEAKTRLCHQAGRPFMPPRSLGIGWLFAGCDRLQALLLL
jgi:hypothetical protein